MSIDQLDLILYDMYRMDAWLPPLFGKWTEDYKKANYSQSVSYTHLDVYKRQGVYLCPMHFLS